MHTSSVVKAWSFIGKQEGSSKLIDVTEPRRSRGASDQTKSAAEQIFLRIVSPSSYLKGEHISNTHNIDPICVYVYLHAYKFEQCSMHLPIQIGKLAIPLSQI